MENMFFKDDLKCIKLSLKKRSKSITNSMNYLDINNSNSCRIYANEALESKIKYRRIYRLYGDNKNGLSVYYLIII